MGYGIQHVAFEQGRSSRDSGSTAATGMTGMTGSTKVEGKGKKGEEGGSGEERMRRTDVSLNSFTTRFTSDVSRLKMR